MGLLHFGGERQCGGRGVWEQKPSFLIPIRQDIHAVYRYLPGELRTCAASPIGNPFGGLVTADGRTFMAEAVCFFMRITQRESGGENPSHKDAETLDKHTHRW